MSPSQLNVVKETKNKNKIVMETEKQYWCTLGKKMAAAAKVSEVSTGTK